MFSWAGFLAILFRFIPTANKAEVSGHLHCQFSGHKAAAHRRPKLNPFCRLLAAASPCATSLLLHTSTRRFLSIFLNCAGLKWLLKRLDLFFQIKTKDVTPECLVDFLIALKQLRFGTKKFLTLRRHLDFFAIMKIFLFNWQETRASLRGIAIAPKVVESHKKEVRQNEKLESSAVYRGDSIVVCNNRFFRPERAGNDVARQWGLGSGNSL